MSTLVGPKRHSREVLATSGEQYIQTLLRRGDVYFDRSDRLADEDDEQALRRLAGVADVLCQLTGLCAGDFVHGPGDRRDQRQRLARLSRRLITAGATAPETQQAIMRLDRKAEALGRSGLPAILAIADRRAEGRTLDAIELDVCVGDGHRQRVQAQLTSTAAAVVAHICGGRRVTRVSLDFAEDRIAGPTTEIVTRRDNDPPLVQHVRDARLAARQSQEFFDAYGPAIDRLHVEYRQLHRYGKADMGLFEAAWDIERAVDSLATPVPTSICSELAERASRSAMVARFADVVTEQVTGLAIPDSAAWVQAALALGTVTDSPQQAQSRFEFARESACAFLAVEHDAIARVALELSRRMTADEFDITRVLGA